MKKLTLVLSFTLSLFFGEIFAQNTQCVHCNMTIKDKLHRAEATIEGKTFNYDAIECLINHIKTKNKTHISLLKVADFKTGELVNAKKATYLVSENIPSPMGANLSAFKNFKHASILKSKQGGILYNWESIKEKFENSSFGANTHNHHRPDAHAPIGVMGDHLHSKGSFMVSFRYMDMTMKENKMGANNISNTEIHNNYMVAPNEMEMKMQMLGFMYAPSDNITLMLMQNFIKKNMSSTAKMMMGGMDMMEDFSTKSSGLGDMKLSALINLFNNHKTSLHINSSINIPVGEITAKDDTPMMNDAKLPYVMQLGSGTLDITLGTTYKENYANTSWGTQFLSIIRTGKNTENYRLGNIYQLNIWGAYNFKEYISFSGRILGVFQNKITGLDEDLNPMMVPAANINNYGGEKIKAFVGMNIAFPKESIFKNIRFGVEAGAPIYEYYNGIQMNENLTLNFGVKYSI